ncbi:MAG: hypothetical protein ACLP9S_12445 [Syntrophales bacterium]
MKKIIVCGLAVVVTLFAIASSTRAGSLLPAVGGTLPDITLLVLSNSTDKNYLGVSGFGSFRIPQTRAKVVVIEIVNMYYPYCCPPMDSALFLFLSLRYERGLILPAILAHR